MDGVYLGRNIWVSFFISLILGPIVIGVLSKLKIGQSVRKDGPKSHLVKNGTPTMGGVIFIISILLSGLINSSYDKRFTVIILSMLGFALIGFIDDYIIVAKSDNKGLTPRQKLILQFVLGLGLSIYHYKTSDVAPALRIPFLTNGFLDMKILYIPFVTTVIVAIVNSANLTDGLDGLASSVSVTILFFFIYIAIISSDKSLLNFTSIAFGALLGFLIYNFYPAKVFMGDTGSFALGGAIASMALITDLILFVPIVCGIFLIEALSVIIQVGSYKLRGKKVFLMSPLHHHFEEKGMKELSVVIAFIIASFILVILGIYGYR